MNFCYLVKINVNQTFFSHPYRWLMHESNANNTEWVENIHNALPDSNIILAQWNDEANHFALSQCITLKNLNNLKRRVIWKFVVYKIEPFSETIYETFGYWSVKTGLVNLMKSKVLSQRRRNLRRKILRASVVLLQNDSVNHLTDYR